MIVLTAPAFTAAIKACTAVIALQGTFPVLAVGPNPCPVQIDAQGATIAGMTFYASKHVMVTGGTFTAAKYATVLLYGADDIRMIGGTYLQPVSAGISVYKSTNVVLEGNGFSDPIGDGIDVASSQFVTVSHNRVARYSTATIYHPDGIAIWSSPGLPMTAHVVVSDNLVVGHTQGVTAFNHSDQGMPGFDDVHFTRNISAVDMPQCVAMSAPATNSDVTVNVCLTLLGAKWAAAVNVDPSIPQSGNVPGIRP